MISARHTGLAGALNEAAELREEADLIVLVDVVGLDHPRWLERLRSAAYSDDIVGAATALSADERDVRGGSDSAGAETADDEVDPSAAALRPHVFLLSPHCSYIRSSALKLVGKFEESLSDAGAVMADYSARMISRGLLLTMATDVRVGGSARDTGGREARELERVLNRHPWLRAAQTEEEAREIGPLRRALVAARARSGALSVTVDARALGSTGGTQTHVHGLLLALAGAGAGRVRAVVRDDTSPPILDELERSGIEVVQERQATGLARTDIAHRPQQVFVPEDLVLLRELGERVVVTHHDLIAYRNPAYHASAREWRRFRRLTRFALSAADRVVFVSEHARRDAIVEELIEPEWADVVGGAITPSLPAESLRRPAALAEDATFLVMIGADYEHKNRLFAIDLVNELHARHGWDGQLVLAGRHVPQGGSYGEEAELLSRHPGLATSVLDLGSVSEAEKQWLLAHAVALLCPSTYEGFGLTPLEAAAAGIPCIYAALASLREVVGEEAAAIVPWDAAETADRVLPLLVPGDERQRHLSLLAEAAGRYTWDSLVDELRHVYRRTIASPYRSSVPRAWDEIERERLVVELDQARADLTERLTNLEARVEHGLPLIDRGGLLTRSQQRGLMRIASRRWLRGPLLGPLGLLGRISRSNGRS